MGILLDSEKTELMLRYEAETGYPAFLAEPGRVGVWASSHYVRWLEAAVDAERGRIEKLTAAAYEQGLRAGAEAERERVAADLAAQSYPTMDGRDAIEWAVDHIREGNQPDGGKDADSFKLNPGGQRA